MHYRQFVCCSASVCLSLATPSFAQLPVTASELGTKNSSVALPKRARFPKFQRFRLSNGIAVWLVTRKDEPTVALEMFVRTGTDPYFQKRLPGTQTLFAELIDNGSESLPKAKLIKSLEEASAKIWVRGDDINVQVHLEVPSNKINQGLSAWADVIMNPLFPEVDLAVARSDYVRYLDEVLSKQPKQTSAAVAERALWGPAHPYSFRASPGSVAQITRKEVIAFHRRWFGPNNAHILVVGDVSAAALRSMLERNFGAWRATRARAVDSPASKRPLSPQVIIVDYPGADEAYIRVISSIPPYDHEKEIARGLFNSVFSRRIFNNLSDSRRLSDAFSALPSSPKLRGLVINAPVKNENLRATAMELRKEIVRSRTEPVTESELITMRAEWSKPYVGRWKSNSAILDGLDSIKRFDLPVDYWDTYLDRIRETSVQEVREAGSELLPDDALIWVFAGDASFIESEIRDLGLGKIELQLPERRRVR